MEVIEYTERSTNEREFLRTISPLLTLGKKIVVQNKFSVENFKSTIIRYVAFNSIFTNFMLDFRNDALIHIKFTRNPDSETENEYIPSTSLVSLASAFNYKNIYVMNKLNPETDWGDANPQVELLSLEWQNRYEHNMKGKDNLLK